MAYEERPQTGTHVMQCDSPQCHIEMISPSLEELHEDLALAGWERFVPDRKNPKDEKFVCPACTRGTNPAATLMKAALGGTDEVMVHAPADVKKGEPMYDDSGKLFGHYMDDAHQGEPVKVKVQLPEPLKNVSALEAYDDMLDGTDADDDRVGRYVPSDDPAPGVDIVTPDGAVALRSPHIQPAPTPKVPSKPVDLGSIGKAFEAFDLGITANTSWDPDAE